MTRKSSRSPRVGTGRVERAKRLVPSPERDANRISDYTVRRLSVYCHILEEIEAERAEVISSARLAKLAGTNSAQVRKDLSYFGNFGKRGRGYQVDELKQRIRAILGIDRAWRVVLVGAGKLGSALYSYKDFERHGFRIVAILDNDATKVGSKWDGVEISHVDECEKVVAASAVEVAVLATPTTAAQAALDRLVKAGVRGILNFAPGKLEVPPGVQVRNVNITIELEGLSFALRALGGPDGPEDASDIGTPS